MMGCLLLAIALAFVAYIGPTAAYLLGMRLAMFCDDPNIDPVWGKAILLMMAALCAVAAIRGIVAELNKLKRLKGFWSR